MTKMVTFHQIFTIALAITIPIFYTSKSLVVVEAENVGFRVDLVHRDSPKSPFYNPSLTPSQRVAAALRRSVRWIEYVSRNGSTDIIPAHGEFLMKLFFGIPSVEILAVVDTGSDLTWIQCEPCTNCFKQKGPIYNPNSSKFYKPLACTASQCHALSEASCNATTNTCQYSVSYGDKSFSHGDLATEIVTFESGGSFPNITFGCGHKNDVGPFIDERSGIVGLGGGPDSLISQMSRQIKGKFCYCLVPFESTKSGKFYFGQNTASPDIEGVVSTPLVPNYPSTFYYVTLMGINFGSERIDVPAPPNGSGLPQKGNMIIDSGTTLTNLPLDIYNQFESAVKKYVKLPPVDDPQGILSLCYNTLKKDYFPTITLLFYGEAFAHEELKLNPSNTFVQTGDFTMCLAFSPTQNNQPAVLGNMAQMNLFVSYDLEKKMVSFKHTNCEKE